MNINTITAEDLRRMPDKEGLILQGCGGDLTEWVDGINEMLTKAGILKDGCQFENVAAFQHGELTCLLYPFDDGNGRTGRLILFKECLKNDIIPFVVNDSRKAEYYHALNTAQTKQDYSLLERFFREEQTEYRQQVEGFLPPVKE